MGVAGLARGGGHARRRGGLAAASARRARGRAAPRRLPALREGPLRGRVRLRLRLGRRRASRRDPLLPEAARRGALHAGDRRALPRRSRRGSRALDPPHGRLSARALRRARLLGSTRELLPRARARGAGAERLPAADRDPVPLAQRGLCELRRLPRGAAQQAAQPGAARARGRARRGHPGRGALRRRDPRPALRADVPLLPRQRRRPLLRTPLSQRALLRAPARALPRPALLRRRTPRRRDRCRHDQRPEGRRALRPLLGRARPGAPPPLRRLLLLGDRLVHRARHRAFRAGRRRRPEVPARLRRAADDEPPLPRRPAPRARDRPSPRRGARRGRARARRAARAVRAEGDARGGRELTRRVRRAALCVAAALAAGSAAAQGLDAALYAELLARHTREVADTAGVRVDYGGLREDAAWPRLVAGLDAARPAAPDGRSEELAFWINVYNVLAIDLVVRHPGVKSIRDVGSFLRPVWNREAGRVAGRARSLGEIEHGI